MLSTTFCLLTLLSAAATGELPAFLAAQPVWPQGLETEKNLFIGFRAVFEKPEAEATLRITGSTIYRVWVNGTFAGYGPARAGHGYYRVDEWPLTALLKPGKNVVAIEVAGYNVNSYYLLDQPAFLQAEIVAAGKALAATGRGADFQAARLRQRIQKVQRYSFQRPFIEAYRLSPASDTWRNDPAAALAPVPCAVTGMKALLPRRVGYPRFDVQPALTLVSRGPVNPDGPNDQPFRDRSLTDIGPKLGGFVQADLDIVVSDLLGKIVPGKLTPLNTPLQPDAAQTLGQNESCIVDLGQNLSGFPRVQVHCEEPVRLILTFDETLRNGDVDWRRLGCVNGVYFAIEPGTYDLECFEPYTARYLKFAALDAGCSISGVGIRRYENPDTDRASFNAPDERLNQLFEAGRATYVQNAVDVFMDCPSRERAGWLCDSFFTARTALSLSGDTRVEDAFLENFLLPAEFKYLPKGMLPMCYPADHNDGVFIPNWAMWFVVQLREYAARGGDPRVVEALEPRVMALLDYFKPFENEDGLLESLESWVFIEWSEANKFVQDVNYPSNMLYAAVLDSAAALYGHPELKQKAEALRETIRTQSWNGTFFVDNAVRKDGKLVVTNNRSEVCQYFAFFFGVASPATHPELWTKLRDEFGPDRKTTKAYADVHLANSFIGNMLRFELLSRHGRCQQILDESMDYLLYMARATGTLWENVGDYASMNHGFASHICHTLYRDVLGVYTVDPAAKIVRLRFTDIQLPWCEGTIPLGAGEIHLRWSQDDQEIRYALQLPDGYRVEVNNVSGKQVLAQ